MIGGWIYRLIYILCRIGLFIWHPIYRVEGRENVPQSGKLVICANHSGMADPIWVVMSLKMGHIPRIMAKKESLSYPILGKILAGLRVIGVDRGMADVHAIKEALRALKEDQQLLIFPEGTRVRSREDSKPKAGALLLAAKTGAPVLPVYISMRTAPFQPVKCIIGKPYDLEFAGKRFTDEEMQLATADLMNRIYAMGDKT